MGLGLRETSDTRRSQLTRRLSRDQEIYVFLSNSYDTHVSSSSNDSAEIYVFLSNFSALVYRKFSNVSALVYLLNKATIYWLLFFKHLLKCQRPSIITL
jgi:hypothetical protein